MSEHYTKEKKVPASKQFNYNKLVNDQRMHYESQHASKTRSKPARPPAPVQQPQEGILIDLSPEEIRSMNKTLQSQASLPKPSASFSLLDEPIEVPTEVFEDQQSMPPPYPMPPQYLNTNSMNDPFDTTHIVSSENFYSNSNAQHVNEPIYNNNPSRYTTTTIPDQLNDMLSASLASLSFTNENINGLPMTPKKVEKQLLSDQLTLEPKGDYSQVKLNLKQLMNVPTQPTQPTIRNYDPFSPISNVPYINNNYSSTSQSQNVNDSRYDIYNSVAGDSVYGENFYDAVQSQTPSVVYDSTASVYSAQKQQAIYDEVSANYDELRWKPQAPALRPAPAPPSQSTLLSQQQITRRLEKINQQHGVIAELMNKLSMDNMTESEALESLEASNWNQDLATRNFKIERLSK